jgi:hypothetical protein
MQHEARYLSEKIHAPTAIVTQKYGFHRQTAWLCSPHPELRNIPHIINTQIHAFFAIEFRTDNNQF